MKRCVIGIEREETTLITKETIYKALEQAYSELRSGECGIVDIVLPLDEPHNYAVLLSVESLPVGLGGVGRKINIWQNEKALRRLNLGKIECSKHMMITQLLDKAFNEVGNLYNLLSLRSEHTRVNSVYNYLLQMIDENFELKEENGRF